MKLITYAQLAALKGIPYTRQWLMLLEREGKFPKRIRLSQAANGRYGWDEAEIDRWMAERAANAQPAAEGEHDERASDADKIHNSLSGRAIPFW